MVDVRSTRGSTGFVGALSDQSDIVSSRRFASCRRFTGRSSLLFRFEGFEPLDARRPPAALVVASSACAGCRLLRASLRAVFLENCRASTSIFVLPSYKEPTVDALAPKTDEGRE